MLINIVIKSWNVSNKMCISPWLTFKFECVMKFIHLFPLCARSKNPIRKNDVRHKFEPFIKNHLFFWLDWCVSEYVYKCIIALGKLSVIFDWIRTLMKYSIKTLFYVHIRQLLWFDFDCDFDYDMTMNVWCIVEYRNGSTE